jgi:hypothetical protein
MNNEFRRLLIALAKSQQSFISNKPYEWPRESAVYRVGMNILANGFDWGKDQAFLTLLNISYGFSESHEEIGDVPGLTKFSVPLSGCVSNSLNPFMVAYGAKVPSFENIDVPICGGLIHTGKVPIASSILLEPHIPDENIFTLRWDPNRIFVIAE